MRESSSSSNKSVHVGPKVADSTPAMRKGPWLPEEDEILLEYVKQFGARDWSSIRSKGLLPRTGKSCRLRWVNKLKPDLKSPTRSCIMNKLMMLHNSRCKFSAEEERIVIELQAKFGNKWARIATYLPGRTDNDVKNFWSTRQKRLARMLQAPAPGQASPPSSSSAAPALAATLTLDPTLSCPPPKLVTVDARVIDPVARISIFQEFSVFEAPPLNPLPFSGEPQCGQTTSCSSLLGNADVITMVPLPDMISENLLYSEGNGHPPQELRCSNTKAEEGDLTISNHIPQPPLDVQFVPMMDEFTPGFYDDNFPADTIGQEDPLKLPLSLPTLNYHEDKTGIKLEDTDVPATPDSFFDDFPTDMFDCSEPVPTPTTLPDW